MKTGRNHLSKWQTLFVSANVCPSLKVGLRHWPPRVPHLHDTVPVFVKLSEWSLHFVIIITIINNYITIIIIYYIYPGSSIHSKVLSGRSCIRSNRNLEMLISLRRGENRKKTSRSREKNLNQLNPLGGECNHHYAIPAPPSSERLVWIETMAPCRCESKRLKSC